VRVANQVPLQGVAPLQRAAKILFESQGAARSLCPMDADCLQLCLLAGAHHLAVRQVTALDVHGVEPYASHLTTVDFLRYWFYGGMAWCGLKDWPKALESFKIAVCMPATSLSAVVAEAYKKMVLVGLLATGKAPALPPYTSDVVVRQLKHHGALYLRLAKAFSANDVAGLADEVAKEEAALNADKNLGLANQV